MSKKKNKKKVLKTPELTKSNNKNSKAKNNKLIINEISTKDRIHLKIQSFISILFTIIIFIALILLIAVLWNNYIKKENKKIDVEKVCKDYIKKDYNIKNENVLEFIKDIRAIIYNTNQFDISNIQDEDLVEFATYFIWDSEGEYLSCYEDINCLTTYKEMDLSTLKQYFKKYFNINDLELSFTNQFNIDDEFRIYENNGKVIITFREFVYQTLRHDIVDINVDSDNIKVIFALSEDTLNGTIYKGYKVLSLKYIDTRFIITKIDTTYKS